MIAGVAWIYAAGCAVVIAFHLALILGAPWGHLTQGGRYDGRLPPRGRGTAALSALLLVWMALAILSAAGQGPEFPRWTAWAALAITAATTIANFATPSLPERRLWGPVTLVLLICAALTVLFGEPSTLSAVPGTGAE